MTDDNNHAGSGNTLIAAALGAIVGVCAGATAMFLLDDKKRNEVIKRTQKVYKNFKDRVTSTTKDVEDKIGESKELLADKLDKTAKKLKN